MPMRTYCKFFPWPTWNGLRKIRAECKKNGFESAFVKVGGTVLIDVDEFHACIERKKTTSFPLP